MASSFARHDLDMLCALERHCQSQSVYSKCSCGVGKAEGGEGRNRWHGREEAKESSPWRVKYTDRLQQEQIELMRREEHSWII